MGVLSSLTGSDAAKAAKKASGQQMAGISQAERYMGDYFDPIQQNQEYARNALFDHYSGGAGQYQQAAQSPQYDYLRGIGEQGVMRNASATGGLRSGNANQALAQSNQGVLQGLVDQNLQGLQYFNNQDAGQGYLADLMMQKAGVQAQGTTAAAQAKQAGMGNMLNMGLGLGQMAMGMPSMGGGTPAGGGSAISQGTFNQGANMNWGNVPSLVPKIGGI